MRATIVPTVSGNEALRSGNKARREEGLRCKFRRADALLFASRVLLHRQWIYGILTGRRKGLRFAFSRRRARSALLLTLPLLQTKRIGGSEAPLILDVTDEGRM